MFPLEIWTLVLSNCDLRSAQTLAVASPMIARELWKELAIEGITSLVVTNDNGHVTADMKISIGSTLIYAPFSPYRFPDGVGFDMWAKTVCGPGVLICTEVRGQTTNAYFGHLPCE